MARFATGLPFRGPADECRGCGSSPDASHLNGCWVMKTLNWAYKNGQNDQRGTTAPKLTPTDDELTAWWVGLARAEAEKVVPKAIEYGATDLVEIGRQLVASGVKSPTFPGRLEKDAFLAELGVYFYVLGKLARWTDAVASGRQVSDDTLHDIGVYVRVAQRIRSHGGWPAVDLKENP